MGPMHKNPYFNKFFERYDLNKDGKVDLNEYHQMSIYEYNLWEEIENRVLSDEEAK